MSNADSGSHETVKITSGNAVINGESDFESIGVTNGYGADHISVQCLVLPKNTLHIGT